MSFGMADVFIEKNNKPTDNEIIKALEDKTHKAEYSWVDGSYCDVEVSLLKNALDLINRQQAEIERLHSYSTYKHAQAEAIKEFAEELKQRMLIQPHYNDFVKEFLKIIHRNIDNLVKEMVGENNV